MSDVDVEILKHPNNLIKLSPEKGLFIDYRDPCSRHPTGRVILYDVRNVAGKWVLGVKLNLSMECFLKASAIVLSRFDDLTKLIEVVE